MEQSIFPRPEVRRLLEQGYVEVRLHTDKQNQVSEELQKLKEERLEGDTSMPIYEIVDPATGQRLDEPYKGADVLSGGANFKKFLERNLRR